MTEGIQASNRFRLAGGVRWGAGTALLTRTADPLLPNFRYGPQQRCRHTLGARRAIGQA